MPNFVSVQNRPRLTLMLLALLCALVTLAFMTLGAKGSWEFILKFRGTKLAGMALVACAIALSTVVFQSITENRILTPGVMGFDALYMAIQTFLVFALGGFTVLSFDPWQMFLIESIVLCGFSMLLFGLLFGKARRDLHSIILAGLIFGVLFRSGNMFLTRVMDPNEFDILQDLSFARFSNLNLSVLQVAAIILSLASIVIWRNRHRLDVITLGRASAINLGVDYRPFSLKMIFVISILVAVSTALAGPVTFLGLLAVHLAYQITGTGKHSYTLPAAAMVAYLCLAGGQVLLERVFAFNTSLSIIIEFVGGILFVALLLRNKNND